MIKVYKVAQQPDAKFKKDQQALDRLPGIFDVEENPATELRRFFERGELPVFIVHSSRNTLGWKLEPSDGDLKTWLPIFIEGLKERTHPHRFIAEIGCMQMIEKGSEILPEMIPSLTLPIAHALRTGDFPTMRVTLKILILMLKTNPKVAEELLPFLNRILRPLFQILLKNHPDDLSVQVNDFLNLIELHGGETAVDCIKYSIPIFDGKITGYTGSTNFVKIRESFEK